MNTTARYIIVVLAVIVSHYFPRLTLHSHTFCQISLHYIVSFTHEGYGRATSWKSITSKLKPSDSESYELPDKFPPHTLPLNDTLSIDRRANASFVILARNSDIDGTVRSIREMEDRFNRKFHYPYVLLNEEPFTDEFKRCVYQV